MKDSVGYSEYTVGGVKLMVPEFILTPTIKKAIESGRYEALEARQIPRFMKHGDRLLELGGGIGFISSLSSLVANLESIVVVEANPELIQTIKINHRLNNVTSDVINAVAFSDGELNSSGITPGDTVPFYIAPNFWGSSLQPIQNATEIKDITVVGLSDLISRYQPSVIVCDIEGGEYNLFDGVNLDCVRLVFLEVHKLSIGLIGINKVFRAMEGSGLYYDPDFSVGATVAFSRDQP